MVPEQIIKLPKMPAKSALIETFLKDYLTAEGTDQLLELLQPPQMETMQQTQSAELIAPFLELGIKIAQIVIADWLKIRFQPILICLKDVWKEKISTSEEDCYSWVIMENGFDVL